jgi:hypothetical protein
MVNSMDNVLVCFLLLKVNTTDYVIYKEWKFTVAHGYGAWEV